MIIIIEGIHLSHKLESQLKSVNFSLKMSLKFEAQTEMNFHKVVSQMGNSQIAEVFIDRLDIRR